MLSKSKPAFRKLLEHGANPNQQNEDGDSPISLAAGIKDDSEWLELILKHKGNPNLVDPKGDFSLFDNQTPLFNAIDSRNLRNIELLLKAGANPNHQDKFGYTPAIRSASYYRYEGVYLLLNSGADCRIENKYGHDLAFECFLSEVSKERFPEVYRYREKVLVILK
jgi:ankyrin repeat protein